MSKTTLLSYLFGIAGIAANYWIYRQKDRRNLLHAKLVSDVVWGIHYALIAAYSGAVTCAIAVFRETVFLNRHRAWASSKLWLLGFFACNAVSIGFTWRGWISIIPACASMISIFLFWVGKPALTRRVQIPISCAYLLYNAANRSYLGIGNEILSLVSIFTFRHKEKKQQDP